MGWWVVTGQWSLVTRATYNIFVATLRSHQATAFHSLHIYSLIVPHDALLEDDTSIADRRRALWMLVRGFFFSGSVQEEHCAGFKLDLVPVWLYQ